MKQLLFTLLTTTLLMSCAGETKTNATTNAEASNTSDLSGVTVYTVDEASSALMWKGSMLGMYDHEGTIKITKGQFTVRDSKVTDGTFVVDMNTMMPTDENYDPENGKGPDALVGHLSSDDFFNTADYPQATLTIEKGKAMLTVRDKTNEVEIYNVEVDTTGPKAKATGELEFDRKDYGVAFDHPAKEMVLSNDIELTFDIVASKK